MSRKLILLTLAILFCFALAAQATETRVATMGNSGLYLRDDAGIFIYPGTMVHYKKMIIAEHFTNSGANDPTPFGYSGVQRVGIVFPGFLNGTWAVFAGQGTEDFTVQGVGMTEPTTRFLLGYGTNTGNSSIGFQVDFSGVRIENNTPPPQAGGATIYTAGTWGVAAGLSTPLGDLNNLDLGFRIRIGKFKFEDDTATANAVAAESDGNTTLSFTLRDYYALNDYVNLVPVGALGLSTQKDIDYSGDTSRFKFSHTVMELGLGVQTKPTENSEIIAGAGYRSSNMTFREFTHGSSGGADSVEFAQTDAHMPFAFLGFEAAVKSWMHFRLGVEKTIDVFKEEIKGPPGALLPNSKLNEAKQGGSSLEYAIGVGIHAGPVTMDALVENQFLNEGPQFLSGETTNVGLFPRVSLTYNFK
jgi:hypothetical protein